MVGGHRSLSIAITRKEMKWDWIFVDAQIAGIGPEGDWRLDGMFGFPRLGCVGIFS